MILSEIHAKLLKMAYPLHLCLSLRPTSTNHDVKLWWTGIAPSKTFWIKIFSSSFHEAWRSLFRLYLNCPINFPSTHIILLQFLWNRMPFIIFVWLPLLFFFLSFLEEKKTCSLMTNIYINCFFLWYKRDFIAKLITHD